MTSVLDDPAWLAKYPPLTPEELAREYRVSAWLDANGDRLARMTEHANALTKGIRELAAAIKGAQA